MKAHDVRERSDDEMAGLVAQLQDDLYRLRVRGATNQLENTASLRGARRAIARARTIARARELGIEASRKAQSSTGEGKAR